MKKVSNHVDKLVTHLHYNCAIRTIILFSDISLSQNLFFKRKLEPLNTFADYYFIIGFQKPI